MSNELHPRVATAALIGALLLPLQSTVQAADLSVGPRGAASDQALPGAGTLLDNNATNPLVPWTSLIDNSDGQPFFWVGSSRTGASISTSADNQDLTYRFLGAHARWGITFTTPTRTFTHVAGEDAPDLAAQPDISDNMPLAGPLSFSFAIAGDDRCRPNLTVSNNANHRPGISIDVKGSGSRCRVSKPSFIAAHVMPVGDGIWALVDDPTEHVLVLLDDGSRGYGKSDYNDMMILISASDTAS